MDFSNRNMPQHVDAHGPRVAAPGPIHNEVKHNKSSKKAKWTRIGVVVAVAAVAILLIGIATVAATAGPKSEDKYIDTSKLQAVFLNTGQVYFGNIKALNGKYFVLTNIYYLQTANSSGSSSSSDNNKVTLVKLGCELHQPYDQMVINSSQVTFWENLQSSGQVAQAVATFERDNPNGQKCVDQSSSSGSTSNTVQSAPTSSGSSSSGSGSSSSTPSSSTTNSSSNP